MAINGIVHGNHESKFGIFQGSDFNAAYGANASAFVEFDCGIPSVDLGVFQDLDMKNHGSRVLEDGNEYTTEAGGIRTISVSDHIVRKADIAELLYAVFQNVSEGVGSPFEKTYTWVGSAGTETTQPDFFSDAGYYATLGIYDPIAGQQRAYRSSIIKSLTVSCDLTGGDGRIKANHEWISGFSSTNNANFAGAWAKNTASFFDFNKPTTKQIGGLDVVLYAFSFTFTNNAARAGVDTSGDAETYAVGMPYSTTGSLTVKYDVNTDDYEGNLRDGTSLGIIQVATGTDGADGNLDFLLDECKITNVSRGYGDPAGQQVIIDFEVQADSSTGNHTTVTVSDAVDQAW